MGQRAGELRPPPSGTAAEVFAAFLRLGCTSFGGPLAHLGYFRTEFVERRGWIDEAGYADIVALCQFLPGPASSQVGFALGLARAGWWGGLAAWGGFTLPSALLLLAFAQAAGRGALSGVAHGLALVAVAVVAQAVVAMARALAPDRARASIAAVSCILVLATPTGWGQIAVMAVGGVAGRIACQSAATRYDYPPASAASPATVLCLASFAVLLAASLAWPDGLAASFYRSGALVFGGGHVVLPLLRAVVVTTGQLPQARFLAGYGAAQAMPGPLFAFAAYLGAAIAGWRGAVVATVAVFLPGLLLVAGCLPFWSGLRRMPGAAATLRGVNAAVVGLLGAALYDPVWTGSVHDAADLSVALAGFVLLVAWRASPVVVVALGLAAGLLLD